MLCSNYIAATYGKRPKNFFTAFFAVGFIKHPAGVSCPSPKEMVPPRPLEADPKRYLLLAIELDLQLYRCFVDSLEHLLHEFAVEA